MKRFFDENGYVVAPGVLCDSDFDPLRKVLQSVVDERARCLFETGEINDLCEDLPLERRLAVLHQEVAQTKRSWNSEVFGEPVYGLASHPALLDLAEDLLGTPEITANGDFWVRPKLPGEGQTSLPWHQDCVYYGPRSYDVPILSLWLPLVDVDERNGCIRVIPGSHAWGVLPVHKVEGVRALVPDEDVEARGHPVEVWMKPGDVLAFGARTFHSSGINTSEGVRWSIDLRYSETGQPLEWLFDKYPAFVARSRAQPGSVETFEQWRVNRERAGRPGP